MQCPSCKGHLLPMDRLASIKRADRKSHNELKSEGTGEFKGSSAQQLKCPRCHMTMRKRPLDPPSQELHADVCESCSLVWLDGGELAVAQLSYQTSKEFHAAQEMKQRIRDIENSPERKAEFESNLAALPEHNEMEDDIPGMGGLGHSGGWRIFSVILRLILRWIAR